MGLDINYTAITELFDLAAAEGRSFLFEHETYALLNNSGAETPPAVLPILKGMKPSDNEILSFPGQKVVLKILSPSIIHKSDVGGVRIVDKTPAKVRATWRRMMCECAENFAAYLAANPQARPEAFRELDGQALLAAVAKDIKGVLMCQFMPPDSSAFGNELIVGLRRTREFGTVVSAGLGGIDTELYAKRFRKGQAIVAAATALTDGDEFFELFKATISYKKLTGLSRGQRRVVTDEQLIECFSSFIEMGNHYSPENPEAPYFIDELEINPFAFTDFCMVPLDGLAKFSRPEERAVARPIHKIGNLLHPETIGVIGVSAKGRNFGRIILGNLLESGVPPERLRVIRPGETEIDGVTCVASIAALENPLDLLVVAIKAEQVPELIETVVETGKAHAVMLIPGGLGETQESKGRAIEIKKKIAASREREDGGPVFVGGNCLGVVSNPGGYDAVFIPKTKLPRSPERSLPGVAFISQSGAFMVTRLSKFERLQPAYTISIGNQTDLTASDFVNYLNGRDDIKLIAVYMEGFNDNDGLAFCQAVRRAALAGKEILFYKAGRTPAGQLATAGHTASLAGDYMVCESCVAEAGAMVAATFSDFEDLYLLSALLNAKKVGGTRLAAVSGAGFEAVGMADSILGDDYHLDMAELGPATREGVAALVAAKGLSSLVEIKNPLDINPAADDELHLAIVERLLADEGVDAVSVGLDPLSPNMSTLALDGSELPESSVIRRLPLILAQAAKPIVGVVDGGSLYDQMAESLIRGGVPTFRSNDRAVRTLASYMAYRLHLETLRAK
jgi:acyl-CoA synthetase (NDP forming)